MTKISYNENVTRDYLNFEYYIDCDSWQHAPGLFPKLESDSTK